MPENVDSTQSSIAESPGGLKYQVKEPPSVLSKEISIPRVFEGSVFVKMKEARINQGRDFRVLFTDIDNTFKMKTDTPETRQATTDIFNYATEADMPVVAITGNDLAGVVARMNIGELPKFSVIASAVGTECFVLHVAPDGSTKYLKDEQYEAKLIASGYDRKAISKLSSMLVKECVQLHPDWALDFQNPGNELAYLNGEIEDAQPFKTSFYAMVDSTNTLAQIQSTFRERFPMQKVVLAEEIGYNSTLTPGQPKKFCIDILPITKAGAVNIIREELGVDVSILAGDSGNDAEMLTGTGNISIQVGGAKPELIHDIDQAAEKRQGKRSFTKVKQSDESVKLYYREKGVRVGPQSILYAEEVLRRAENIAKIRTERNSG